MTSIKKKKLTGLKSVFDKFGSSSSSPASPSLQGAVKLEQELAEPLVSDDFTLEYTSRHGFPFRPLSMAYDPIQKLLAIGDRSGNVRIFGKPGVNTGFKHKTDCQVLQIVFIFNEGKLLTACSDDTVNLWDFRKKSPELVQTLQLSREHLTFVSLEFQDKWAYIGTDRGNVYIIQLETFQMSGYHISWNKMIDPMQKNHPGAVCQLGLSPTDHNRLLVGFESGTLCLWDLAAKKRDSGFHYDKRLYSFSWNMDGRHFVCSFGDGSLVTWSIKSQGAKPPTVNFPHAKKKNDSDKVDLCGPIEKVVWAVSRNSDPYYIFSGGLPEDVTGMTPSITITHGPGKGSSNALMEMEQSVLDFVVVTDSPFASDFQEPEAVIIMLSDDLVVIDYKSPGHQHFSDYFSMTLNESPVTFCKYFADCSNELKSDFNTLNLEAKKQLKGIWPISGGQESELSRYPEFELVVTGHADGSVKFWDASLSMELLHKFSTSQYFDKRKNSECGGIDLDPFAIIQIDMCLESRVLAVAAASGQVILSKFIRDEAPKETKSIVIPIVYEVSNLCQNKTPNGAETCEFPPPRPALLISPPTNAQTDTLDGLTPEKEPYDFQSPFKVREVGQVKCPAFHADLICLTPWVNREAPTPIACITVNSTYGLLAYGNGSGLVIVDYVQKICLLNVGTSDLYGFTDPFIRIPRSPRSRDPSLSPSVQRIDLGRLSLAASPKTSPTGQQKEASSEVTDLSDPSFNVPAKDLRVKSMDNRLLQKTVSSPEGKGFLKSLSLPFSSTDKVVQQEGVTAVSFADSFIVKSEFKFNSSLFIGTSLGSVIIITIHLPSMGDPRLEEAVVVAPSGTLFRNKGSVLAMAFLDSSSNGLTIRGDEPPQNVKSTKRLSSGNMQSSPPSGPSGDQQVAIFCTDSSAVSYGLPSQQIISSQVINENFKVIAAKVISFRENVYTPCLVCYTTDGHIKAYSVPSLKPLTSFYFIAMSSPRIGFTMSFSDYGLGVFFPNPSEIQKFTLNPDFVPQIPESCGNVYVDNIPMPDPPKQVMGLIKGLFGGGAKKQLDRDELFGESAGKASTSIAKSIPGSGLASAQAHGTQSEASRAKMALVERGQRLNELEDRTEQMAENAREFGEASRTLSNMYKNKKWYQL